MTVKKITPAQQRETLLTRLWALLEKEITVQEAAGEIKSFATLVTILDKLSDLRTIDAKTPKLKNEDLDIIRRAIIKRLELLSHPPPPLNIA
jgi:hypothetical protein